MSSSRQFRETATLPQVRPQLVRLRELLIAALGVAAVDVGLPTAALGVVAALKYRAAGLHT
jgi:hypothetical protein